MNIEDLITERLQFEIYIYDYLVEPQIPDSFWEPVPVTLNIEQIYQLPDFIEESECIICYENHINFKKLNCCNNLLCNTCAHQWFSNSVKCPYCNHDQRT
jgi:hypothetical protein